MTPAQFEVMREVICDGNAACKNFGHVGCRRVANRILRALRKVPASPQSNETPQDTGETTT